MALVLQRVIGKDLYDLLQALVNAAMAKPLLATGTTTTRVKTTNAISFRIGGKVFTKAATDPVDNFNASLVNTGASQFCKVRIEMDAAGVVTAVQGAIVAAQALAPMPRRTANKVTLGWMEVPASFTFGTTSYASVAFFDGDPDLGDGGGAYPPGDRGISQDVHTGA